MREKYSKPYTEIEKFKIVDILTTSGGIGGTDDDQPDTDIEWGT